MSVESEIISGAKAEGMPDNTIALMLAQSKHESTNYTSNVFRKNNNAFGMTYGGQVVLDKNGNNVVTKGSDQCDNGCTGLYAKYPSVYYSAVDAARWLKRHIKNYREIKTVEEYATALKNNKYYTAPLTQYISNMKSYFTGVVEYMKIFAKNNPKKTVAGILIGATLLSYTIWLIVKKKYKP